MKGRIYLKIIRKHEAMYLRSQNVFVPEYNKRHKKKYLLITSPQNMKVLDEYLKSVRC